MTTLKELSKLLNLSISTISKALNNSEEISESTKIRVQELALKLNYKPNRIAQQLKTNQTNTIGVILPTVKNPFFAEVLHSIEATATALDYDIIVCLSDESFEKEKRSLELLSNGSVDGFIMAVARETQVNNSISHIQTVINNKIPLLMFDRVIDDIDCNKVIVDDFLSVHEATLYLITKESRKNILLISNIEELSVGKLRIRGYEDAMVSHNLKPKILELSRVKDIEVSVLKYLKTDKTIDGIISIDHITGIVAINTCHKLNFSIPKKISIIGFGYNHTQLLSMPKISIIHQKGTDIGKKATKSLVDKIKNKHLINTTQVISSELQLSESTMYTNNKE